MRTATQIPLVDLRAQYLGIKDEIDEAIQSVVEDTSFILGPHVQQFENEFAAYVQAAGSVGVGSGTVAIELVLRALGIGAGDEVITTAHTFIATAEAVSNVGATPVFVDVEEETLNLDPELVEAAISPRTRAIMPVHLYGHPARMDALAEIAERRNLFLVEDAAQAHGAEVDGRRCGSIGVAACFSFYPGKNLGAYGDAGAITSNDADLLAAISKLRDHGRTTKYEHDQVGVAARMDGIQGAILSAKLRHLEEWTQRRRAIAARYSSRLADSGLRVPTEVDGARHVYHLYVVRSDRREAVLEHLRDAGVAAGIHYPIPLHLQPAYASLGYERGQLPVTERAAASVLSLPMYPELTHEQVDYIVETILEFAA